MRRKQFSIAHELGHWRFHRGKTLVCRVDEYRPRDGQSPEKIADAYAADLLMPRYLFGPRALELGQTSFGTIGSLAEEFKTSLTATAIRLINLDHVPGFVICHSPRGRKWFARAPSVPRHWFPREDLDAKSFGFGVQFGGRPDDSLPRKIGAEAWFDRQGAARFIVREQTIKSRTTKQLAWSSSTIKRCLMIASVVEWMARSDIKSMGFASAQPILQIPRAAPLDDGTPIAKERIGPQPTRPLSHAAFAVFSAGVACSIARM